MESRSSTDGSAKAIFFAVIDIVDPAERSRYVDDACGGDELLREEVDQLLSAHLAAGDHRLVGAIHELNPRLANGRNRSHPEYE